MTCGLREGVRWWVAPIVCAGLSVLGTRASRAQDTTRQLQLADRGPAFVSAPEHDGSVVNVRNAPALQRRVDLEFDHIPLRAALDEITKRTGLRFLTSNSWVPLTKDVSVSASHITVAAALTELLIGTALDVQLSPDGRVLALIPKPDLAARAARQDGGSITGRVTDAVTRTPLDQVAVGVDGPGLGAVTTSDGRYTVRRIPPGTYRVTARRVGYTPLTKTITVTTEAAAAADFALAAVPTQLNEVVTTAVGDQRRYQVGNVISTIKVDSIAPTAPVTSLTDLISARAPGVDVLENSGLTGSGQTIRIRGQPSLVLQGDPILIVDGVRQDARPPGVAVSPIQGAGVPSPARLNDINFADVETIDVLKGPAASTEYGTDAANGVIVITTKHGTAGRPQWHASAERTASDMPVTFPEYYYGWGHTTDASHTPVQCPLVPNSFNLSVYGVTAGNCAIDSVTHFNPLNHPHYSLFGQGARAKYDLSVAGGNDALRYFVAGGLSNETGIARIPDVFRPQATAVGLPPSVAKPNGEDQRSVRANTAIRWGPAADLAVTGAYLSTYQETPSAYRLTFGPLGGPVLPDSVHFYGYGYGFASPINQFGLLQNEQTDRLTGALAGNWRPTPWLVAHGTVGLDHGAQRNRGINLPQSYFATFGVPNHGASWLREATTNIYSTDLRASATATLAPAVRAVTSIGLQLVDTRVQGLDASTSGGVSTTNLTLNGATNVQVAQTGDREATLGGYGEEQVSLADRLFLTGALRVDAASGFGRNYSTAAYPKASASWVALNRAGTTVRVRGAYGESGVQPRNGAAFQLYASQVKWLNGGAMSVYELTAPGNLILQPERSAELEGGIDIGLWANRLSMEVTGYSKATRNALVDVSAGWNVGNFTYEENIGQVRNTGVEGTVNATVLHARHLTWDLSLNAAVNHNKLISLAPGVGKQRIGAGLPYSPLQVAGYPLYGHWGTRVQYADLNHDGIIEPNEVTAADSASFLGSSVPTREASLATHVGLGGGAIAVGALLDYRGGFRVANQNAAYAAQNSSTLREQNVAGSPLWLQARAVAVDLPSCCDAAGFPSGFFEDGTYLRFRELSLTYAVPGRWSRAIHVQSVSLTGAVRNLALWTRYTGPDPEANNGFVGNQTGGNLFQFNSNQQTTNNNVRADLSTVPLARYWVVRLNLGL